MQTPCQQEPSGDVQTGGLKVQGAAGRMMPTCFRHVAAMYSQLCRGETGIPKMVNCPSQAGALVQQSQVGPTLDPARAHCMGQKRTRCHERQFSSFTGHSPGTGQGNMIPAQPRLPPALEAGPERGAG